MRMSLLAADPPLVDTGNNAWLLTSAALVLLMTPGLAFFYGGMVRRKNVLNMLMMSFGAMGVVGVVYVLWGYSMSFADNVAGGLFGNPATFFGMKGLFPELNADGTDVVSNSVLSGSGITALTFVAFQLTFAIITVALISGSVADRMKFSSWLIFAGIWVTLVYFPLAHMVWGGGLLSGWENGIAAKLFGVTDGAATVAPIDFAGGTVVHINAGVAGGVLAFLLGKRRGFGSEPMRPHNVPFVMLGAGLLWFGWFGFNAGSAGAANGSAGLAWLNTSTASSAAMLGWLGVEMLRDKKATGVGAASGVVAGLVAITPAAGALSPVGSIVLGLVAGGICSFAVGLKYRMGLDDSLDVVGVHLVGGIVGTVGVGFLSTTSGLFYGFGGRQLVVQIVIAACAIVFSGVLTLLIGLALKRTIGIRAPQDSEFEGLDTASHGESAYDDEAMRSGGILSHAGAIRASADPGAGAAAPVNKEGASA
ncbi:ammonium transporter [Nakamurella aerolata]|uniref:Ammonium transporter n=1 Tax=Nakamurella aerolata TaxID=1656892 RepID=A0A849A0N3_9ACTN|nr:ammonium transporter [Nakamurella aerolata]NNG34604.1 ammonium transporter [Nakamurella aerolata]